MLTPRLECIVKQIYCKTAADIGTDHAYVPIRLIQSGRAERAIACDVIPGPLKNADKNIREYNLSDKIETRRGFGLEAIKESEADVIIIAGMGGDIIKKILEKSEKTAKSAELILQPMKAQYELRKFLIENCYTITGEDIAAEGFKVYNILKVKDGEQKPFDNEIDYHIPPYLYSHKLIRCLYEKKMREFKKITAGIERSLNPDKEKYELNRYFLEEMKRIKPLLTGYSKEEDL